jgi:hypothetical protein
VGFFVEITPATAPIGSLAITVPVIGTVGFLSADTTLCGIAALLVFAT